MCAWEKWPTYGILVIGLGYSLIATMVISCNLANRYVLANDFGLDILIDICSTSVRLERKKK